MRSALLTVLAAGLAIVMLYRLSRALPLQNVLPIGLTLGFAGSLLEWLLGGNPFVPALFLWPGLLLAGRAIAKELLVRWRHRPNYGLGLILLAGAWVPPVYFLLGQTHWKILAVRFVASVLSLVAVAPWFIQKKPAPGKI